jgi:3-hydroxymyristoyl/3-hydroxydecanoyl-(acyl carrier protein) dehydratase
VITEPIVAEQRVVPPSAELELRITPELECFKGHFPGVPVVAGVVQVKWAIDFGSRYLGPCGDLVGMDVLKFQQVMGPDLIVTLSLTWTKEDGKLEFAYRAGDVRFSSGRLLFRSGP